MSENGRQEEKQAEKKRKSDHSVFSRKKNHVSPLKNHFFRKVRFLWLESCIAFISKYKLEPKIAVLALAIFLSFFIFREIADPHLDYRKGKIAQRHLIAKNTIEFVDKATSEKKRQDAVGSILSVYDFDQFFVVNVIKKIQIAFSEIREKYPILTNLTSLKYKKIIKKYSSSDDFQKAKENFSNNLGIDLTEKEFLAFVKVGFSRKFEKKLPHIFSSVEGKFIVLSKEVLDYEKNQGIAVNYFNKPLVESREDVLKDFSQVVDIKEARKEIISIGKKIFLGRNFSYELASLKTLTRVLNPNLTANKQETEKRKQAASSESKPVMIKINRGDSIVRYGDKITDRHFTILKYLQEQRKKESSFLQFLFTVILLSTIIYSLFVFNKGMSLPYEYSRRDLFVFLLIGAATIVLIKGLQFIAAEAIVEKFPQIPIDFYYYIVPVAAGPAIVRMITSKQPAFSFMIIISVISGILSERNFFYATYVLISSLVATSLSVRIKTRAVIHKMGLITGFVNVIVIICIVANTRNAASLSLIWNDDMGWILCSGLLSGLLTSAVVFSVVPLMEQFFRYTTDLRLLELGSMDHPLLRKLLVRAPGTYHHSMVIGSLVEKAAEDIQANPLLARVMSYYHDVGKMERPLYFIENQAGGYNRHDSLQPHMSAMIIKDHVKKGQELGRKYKLPQSIIDAMSEHHGSSTITYFYNKARRLAEEPDSISESDYQYDGAKPQSKESALVMLGDVVEAATRSLADPNHFRLSGVVKNVLNKYFVDGHLSECNLTLEDLDRIASSFVQVLIGIYHARIDYGVPITSDLKANRKNGAESATTNPKTNHHKSSNRDSTETSSVKYISEAARKTSRASSKSAKKR